MAKIRLEFKAPFVSKEAARWLKKAEDKLNEELEEDLEDKLLDYAVFGSCEFKVTNKEETNNGD